MAKQVDELRRKIDQGSQQLQGEVLEKDILSVLKDEFRDDVFEDVPTGRAGSDIVQKVNLANGTYCGSIIWEVKNTKAFSQEWLPKIRKDQRENNADLAVIVSVSLPKTVEGFDRVDNVWVSSQRHAVSLAKPLRQALIETRIARTASEDRGNKAERAYDYLTGQGFRQRIMAIMEAYVGMKGDLDSEKRSMQKQWAKREKQLEGLVLGTAGLYGDLQGIAGKSMPEVVGLDLPQIEAPGPIIPLDAALPEALQPPEVAQ
jgi:hypothetical protein